MQQYRDTDYAAVSAALHAREAKLLTQAMAERMIDAATPEESYKTLLECGYAPLERCTLENVEHALSQARRELYREVSVLAPDKRIIELFQIKYDYHNAKLALKSKRTGEDFKKAKEALGDLARSEEDIMSYICYPDQAMKFFEDRKAKEENICKYVIEEA